MKKGDVLTKIVCGYVSNWGMEETAEETTYLLNGHTITDAELLALVKEELTWVLEETSDFGTGLIEVGTFVWEAE